MRHNLCRDILIKIDIFLADEEYYINNDKKALDMYKSLLNKYPFLQHNYYVLQQIGGAYLSMEKYDEALIYLEESYAVYPEKEFFNKFYLIKDLAYCIANRNDFSHDDVNKAIEILEKNIHFFKDHIDYYSYNYRIGFYYKVINNFIKAIVYYTQALEILKLKKTDEYDREYLISIYSELAFCYNEAGKPKEAEKILREFFKQNQEDSVLLIGPLIEYAYTAYLLGKVVYCMRIIKRVRKYYKKVNSTFPKEDPTFKYQELMSDKWRPNSLLKGIAKYYGLIYIVLYPFLFPISLEELK